MPSDRDKESERDLVHENAALRKEVEWLSRQAYGRVMPGLFSLPGSGEDLDLALSEDRLKTNVRQKNTTGVLREPATAYHASAQTSMPENCPQEEATLELPHEKRGGMSVAGYESTEAIAVRPAVIRRTIRRALYVSNDGSGLADAAPAPALFPDPSGGPRLFDASFVAHVTVCRLAGMTFRMISSLLETESGLAISETALRGLVLAAAETVAPVCTAMVSRTLPGWMNLRRMFEEAKDGGDWLADDFLKNIRSLCELEELARIRADRLGGAPEDLYRERRAVRKESARIAAGFFERCRETLAVQDPRSPLAGMLRHAIEHERILSEFLHDPRLELSRANPETPVADPIAVLAICADECRMRGVSFRTWLEDALVKLKQPNPPPFESLFPH